MKYRILVESQWILHMLQHGIIKPETNASLEETTAQLEGILKKFDVG